MGEMIVRAVIAASIIVGVAEVSKRFPLLGAVLLTLPIISILAFTFSWFQHHDMKAISMLSRDTLILLPMTLPYFIPFALAERYHLSFWTAMVIGLALMLMTIGAWMSFDYLRKQSAEGA